MNKMVQWTLNLTAGIFAFVFFLFLFFPFELLIQNFLAKIEAKTNGAWRVTVGKIEAGVIFKSVFRDFQLHQVVEGRDEILLDFPEVKVGLSYLPMMTGTIRASFEALGKKGKMEGDLLFSSGEYRLDTEMSGIQFADIRYLSTWLKVPLDGILDGTLDVTIYPGQVVKNRGIIDLKLKNLKIFPTRITPYPGFDLELPETVFSDEKGGVIKIEMNQGKLELKEVSFPGEDVILNLKGKIQLNKKIDLSRLAINGRFSLSKKMQEVLPFVVMIESQKTGDGSYPLTLSGRFNKPRVQVGTFDVL